MPAGTNPIFPQTPLIGIGSLAGATGVTSRAPISGTTNLTLLANTSTNGTRVDAIRVTGQGTTTSTLIGIWINDGTNSYLYDEIAIAAVSASTTVQAAQNTITYTTLVVPSTYRLYCSQTVQSNVSVIAFGGQY
jgi:hypothetical protein